MPLTFDRRDFVKLAGLGGVVFASGLGRGIGSAAAAEEFFFVQLSDTHWGYAGPANPEATTTLKRAVTAVNALAQQPDFIVFTGDLTHTTDDAQIRRKRMAEFRDIVSELRVKTIRFMPGEHDASLDRGDAYKEFFGAVNYTFDHKGVHFIALDNVTDPGASLGEKQIAWLAADLKQLDPATPIVVLTHRPLFDLAPDWDWATKDAKAAIDLLMPFKNVTVFYGHIHHEHHQMTGHIAHHAAKSLIFPLTPVGSAPKKGQIPWDPAKPFAGLGWRGIEAYPAKAATKLAISEKPVA